PEFNPVHVARGGGPSTLARVIVKLKDDSPLLAAVPLKSTAGAADTRKATAARASALGARNGIGLDLTAGRAIDETTPVVLSSAIDGAGLAALLAREPDVEYASVDERMRRHAVPNDPLYLQGPAVSGLHGGPVAGQWYLRAPSGEVQSSINAPAAWDITTGVA